MEKKSKILIVILAGSLFCNVFLFKKEVTKDACDNTGRYSKEEIKGALRLTDSEGAELVAKYRADFPPDHNNNHPTGFVFTKRMFDEVFENPAYNSVTLDLVTYSDNISLVVKGYNTKSTKIEGDGENQVYVIQSFCPIDCSIW
jgi:hypothetical protein